MQISSVGYLGRHATATTQQRIRSVGLFMFLRFLEIAYKSVQLFERLSDTLTQLCLIEVEPRVACVEW